MSSNKTYWFPAKRYGWGWGLPCAWQGWTVLAVFVALLAGGAYFLERLGLTLFVGYAMALGLVLIVVCWIKGEPPRWRWGGK